MQAAQQHLKRAHEEDALARLCRAAAARRDDPELAAAWLGSAELCERRARRERTAALQSSDGHP